MKFLFNKYLLAGLCIYTSAALYLIIQFHLPAEDVLFPFIIFGIGFCSIAGVIGMKLKPAYQQPAFKNEILLLLVPVVLVVLYISLDPKWMNSIFPKKWQSNEQITFVITIIRKLLLFTVIPFVIYHRKGFRFSDFGLTRPAVKLNHSVSLIYLFVFTILILLFQFYLSNGGKNLLHEKFSAGQLVIGIPLCFLALMIEAGLVEEFFFRGFLQSRLASILRSETGGIIVASIIFGLVHAPGLFLRGAAGEEISEPMPFIFWCAYSITFMSIAGIFLGIIYSKTKNLWLVICIHAIIDLIPNLSSFIHTWHI